MRHIVFGAGICTLNNWKYIKKYFKPDIITDNDQKKWGKHFADGIKCVEPNKVFGSEAVQVLISVGDPYIIEQIKAQLAECNVISTTIYEFVELYSELEKVPEKLEQFIDSVNERRILLFNTPEHNNIGDHLIAIAEEKFINKNFPDCEYVEVTDVEYLWHHKWIRENITCKDIILISGGGFLGSLYLYNGELNVRGIISEFPENKIVVFPQTLFFEDNARGSWEREKTKEVYRGHENLTVCLREKKSYETAVSLWGDKIRLELIPDIALSLNFSKDRMSYRSGKIGLCLRNDKESLIGEDGRKSIFNLVIDRKYGYAEMTMRTDEMLGTEDRVSACEKKINEIKSFSLVITDALHCMISCVITGTPCIAINNTSHKVKHMYNWVRNLCYIRLIDDIGSMGQCLDEMRSLTPQDYNSDWYDIYMDKLVNMIGEI